MNSLVSVLLKQFTAGLSEFWIYHDCWEQAERTHLDNSLVTTYYQSCCNLHIFGCVEDKRSILQVKSTVNWILIESNSIPYWTIRLSLLCFIFKDGK
jgi:hypothetical protein